MTELDIDAICRIDEKVTGRYRPEVWERRVVYYIRRDPDSSQIAESAGKVVGFMLGEVRGGEFGLEEPTGWVEFMGVLPDARGKDIGRRLLDALLGHFRAKGAQLARTIVAQQDAEIASFLKAVGFSAAALAAYERKLGAV